MMKENDNDSLHNSLLIEDQDAHYKNGESYGKFGEKRPSVLRTVTPYILICEFCERLAYYGFAGSIILFFQINLNYSNAKADTMYQLWSGFCYLTPLLGGWIADSYLGRFKTILLFCSVYLVGLVLVVIATDPEDISAPLMFLGMYIISFGTGGIKPNVNTFGADQFDDRYKQDVKEKESFFDWFYWSVNIGALISYTLVAYICQFGLPGLVSVSWGFVVGFSIPAISMTIGIMVFVSGYKKYKYEEVRGSVIGMSLSIIWDGLTLEKQNKTNNKSNNSTQEHWLEFTKIENGGKWKSEDVDAIIDIFKLFPYLLVYIPFWGVYGNMNTTYQNQACQMNLNLGGNNGFNIPVASLNIFDSATIIILIPIFEKWLYPVIRMSMINKICLGFIFASLSVVMAGVIEEFRMKYVPTEGYYPIGKDNINNCKSIDDYDPHQFQKYYEDSGKYDKPANCHHLNGCNDIDDEFGYLNTTCIECDMVPQASDISVLYQIPQFILMGIAEILSAVTGLQFFYSQAPSHLRSLAQALNLLTIACGSFILIPLLMAVNSDENNKWIPANLNNGHLEYFFYLLAGVMLITCFILKWISRSYVLKAGSDPNDYNNMSGRHSSSMFGLRDSEVVLINSSSSASTGQSDGTRKEGVLD